MEMLGMRNMISEMRNSFDSIIIRADKEERNINKIEDEPV